jgi:AcrR family transcriptional regulator
MKQSDIRTRFTQKALRESLLSLMKKKSILDISVKEICAGAGVGRSTFYAYCRDQYDLLRQIEDEAFSEGEAMLHEFIEPIKTKPSVYEFNRVIEDMLHHIEKDGNSIQVLLGKNGDPQFQRRFFQNFTEHLRRYRKKTGGEVNDEKVIRYTAFFVAGGFITLIQEWLKNGMDMPVPELAKLLAKMTKEVMA